MVVQPWPARWVVSRPAGRRPQRTSRLSPIYPANGPTRFMAAVRPRGVVLDMDSSVSPTHGEQEMSVWNGHYECICYHPLFVFNRFGNLERCNTAPRKRA